MRFPTGTDEATERSVGPVTFSTSHVSDRTYNFRYNDGSVNVSTTLFYSHSE